MLQVQLSDHVPASELLRFKACIASLPEELRPSPHGPFIVGGALRAMIAGERLDSVADIDVFFPSPERLRVAIDSAARAGWRVKRGAVDWLAHAHRASLKLDLVSSPNGATPQRILEAASFTIGQFVFDGSTLFCTDLALADGRAKLLRENHCAGGGHALSCAMYALKFLSRGYRWAEA